MARFSPVGIPANPDGDVPKDVLPAGGLSGYKGLGGSLVGVFLDDAIPLSDPPATLDFSDAGLGTAFANLAPELGQIFFIGDGLTGTGNGVRQRFEAPVGATRLLLGTMDGAGLGGPPGFYTDNEGSFRVQRIPADLEVAATDAISLAGRTDVVIPAIGADLGALPIVRTEVGPGQAIETFPITIPVASFESLRFHAFGSARFSPVGAETGPDGDVLKDFIRVGGISGYRGLGGALVGVFLDDEVPLLNPPAALDFTPTGLGTNFGDEAPELGQIFYIGDGLTDDGDRQVFYAPTCATRVLLGTADSVGLGGLPGFYTDNSGVFLVNLVPEPALALLSLASVAALAGLRRGAGAREIPRECSGGTA